jgi:hypothetical protein
MCFCCSVRCCQPEEAKGWDLQQLLLLLLLR